MLDRKIFKSGLEKLELVFNMNLKVAQIDLWYKYCQNLEDREFSKKVDNCIMTCKHKPYIADLLDMKEKVNFVRSNAGAYDLI